MKTSLNKQLKRLARNIKFLLKNDFKSQSFNADEALRSLLSIVMSEPDFWLSENKNKHLGERCFLLGCGPSIKNVDLHILNEENLMGVNGMALVEGLKLDYFCSVSKFFWESHQDEIKDINCRRFLPSFLREDLKSNAPTSWLNSVEVKHYKVLTNQKPWRFSLAPDNYVFLGGTVIFVCLQILYHLGFKEVILLGLDHDYGLTPEEIKKAGRKGMWKSSDSFKAHFTDKYYKEGQSVHIDILGMERAYELAKKQFEEDGRSILNATEGSKLETFKKVNLSDYTNI